MGVMSDFVVKDDNPPPRYPPYPTEPHIDDDDGVTLYRDDESYISDSESILSSTASSVFHGLPATKRRQAIPTMKSVFECWKLSLVPEKRDVLGGTRVLGVDIKEWDRYRSKVDRTGVVKSQPELAEMYQAAIASHEAKRKRSWPARVVRGKPVSYEEDLERRCHSLPAEIQDKIKDLLLHRGNASSTCYRQRTWTVVYMEERYVHRFTRTQGAKVTRHKIRFWKNPKSQQSTEYHIVIRGAETGVAEGQVGYTTPMLGTDPWHEFDWREVEFRSREREQTRRHARDGMRRARSISRPRNRYRRFESPLPRERRQPFRSPSCDSYTSEDNYSWRRGNQDESEFRSRPRVFNPIPVSNRPAPMHYPPAPTPPQSFTPPPGVSRFRAAPRSPPPPPPSNWYMAPATEDNPFLSPRPPNPFHSPGVCPPYSTSNAFQAPPPPPTELPVSSLGNDWPGVTCYPPSSLLPFPGPPKLKSLCAACKSTPACGHFPGPYCARVSRPGIFPNTAEVHPECGVCRVNLPRRPQEVFGAGAPTAYTFTNCGNAPQPWSRRPPPSMWEYFDGDEDNATVLDEDDDDASEHDSHVNATTGDMNEDDDDTQVEELVEAPNNEVKEA
ncbi:hypothetical protein V8F06_008184 [Rhypophila decipiens]